MIPTSFDPSFQKNLLLDSVGGFEWSLCRDFEKSKAAGGLGSSAYSHLGQAIYCFLVGFDEPAERLLKQAAEWVQIAIELGERPQRYFPGADEATRFQTLALCNWFLSNQHDAESLRRFVNYEDDYLNAMKPKDKVEVSLTLVSYVNAGAFKRALEIIDSTTGLSAPTSLSPRNEAQMAYIICQYHLGTRSDQVEFRKAATIFLARNINKWLCNGHSIRAAEWLKVLCWNDLDQPPSAKKALMKCYDYLKT